MDATHASLDTPKWYYEGEDHQIYGPYSSLEMQEWFKAGYFGQTTLIRTEAEDRFHSLAEWRRYCNGQSPFMTLVNSFEHLIGLSSMNMQLSQLILAPARVPPQAGPFVMVPPPTTTGSAPPVPVSIHGYSPVAAAANFIAYPPNPLMIPPPASSVPAYHPFSQPPSEPVDELPSSASNTPDDSESGSIRHSSALSVISKSVGTDDAPWSFVRDAGTDTLAITSKGVAVQTVPIQVTSSEASRLLSELLGITVHIT